MNRRIHRDARGFSLVELAIVVLIVGILSAVAAPAVFGVADDARDNATRHSLAEIRKAIELYRAQHNALPGELGTMRDFATDVMTLLSGPFPEASIGNTGRTVRISTSGAPLAPSGTESWAYDNVTGEFIVNHSAGAGW